MAEALRDPTASVRARAVQSLRRMNHPDVDRLISTAMTGDSDPAVRSAAVDAALSRPLGPFVEPLAALVRTDKVAHVRIHAIQAMADYIDASPQLQQALVAAATGDPSPGVKQMARPGARPAVHERTLITRRRSMERDLLAPTVNGLRRSLSDGGGRPPRRQSLGEERAQLVSGAEQPYRLFRQHRESPCRLLGSERPCSSWSS